MKYDKVKLVVVLLAFGLTGCGGYKDLFKDRGNDYINADESKSAKVSKAYPAKAKSTRFDIPKVAKSVGSVDEDLLLPPDYKSNS